MKRIGAWLKGEFGNVAIAVSLAAFLGVVLPVQTYLANASLFVFTPGRLALELAILFVALTAAVYITDLGVYLNDYVEAARRFSSEIEYSDVNIETFLNFMPN